MRARLTPPCILKATFGFNDAEYVVVSGCSAGGAAAFFHTDWFAAQAKKAKTRVRVVGPAHTKKKKEHDRKTEKSNKTVEVVSSCFFLIVSSLPRQPTKMQGMPDSGWFLDGNYARDGKEDYDALMKVGSPKSSSKLSSFH